MAKKTNYEDLEQRIEELEMETVESKRSEAALSGSEEKLRLLLENADAGICYFDTQGKVELFNKRAAEYFGWKTEDSAGKSIYDILPKEVADFHMQRFTKIIREGKGGKFEDLFELPKGKEYFLSEIQPVKDSSGKTIGIQCISNNITERKRTEEALKSQLELEQVVANISTSFINLVPEEIDDGINRALETIGTFAKVDRSYVFLFYDNGTMMDNTHEWCAEGIEPQIHNLQGLSVDAAPWWMDKLNRFENIHIPCVADLPPEASAEKEILEAQDIQSLVVVPMVYGGSLLGFIGFDSVRAEKTWPEQSITLLQVIAEIFANAFQRKRAEEEKKRLEAYLIQAQKMESVGTLAGGVAHDFNNLLMGIQGNVSLMLLNMDSTHRYYEKLKNIEKQVESGARLTSHLLGYARKGKYEVKSVDLNQLVEETSGAFGRTRKEITIYRELAEGSLAIEADTGQIEQVLLNLFVNAADAMPGGGDLILKTIHVTHKDMKGRLYDPRPGKYILLTVTDTGVGMDKETLERVFDPFFTTKEMDRGTGLGLASAYGIIKAHGGYIDVESKKGEGTTFSIYLPPSEKEIHKVVKRTERLVKGNGTVLLVDDEEFILEVGKELLEGMGYRVLIAKNGREGIEAYKKDRDEIDIVLLDMVMPTMGGGEAYDRMKEINPDIKVLLSSGFSIDGEASEILERGCDGFIQKPFTIRELSGKVSEILDKE